MFVNKGSSIAGAFVVSSIGVNRWFYFTVNAVDICILEKNSYRHFLNDVIIYFLSLKKLSTQKSWRRSLVG